MQEQESHTQEQSKEGDHDHSNDRRESKRCPDTGAHRRETVKEGEQSRGKEETSTPASERLSIKRIALRFHTKSHIHLLSSCSLLCSSCSEFSLRFSVSIPYPIVSYRQRSLCMHRHLGSGAQEQAIALRVLHSSQAKRVSKTSIRNPMLMAAVQA